MNNAWSESEAAQFRSRYGPEWGEDLALRIYLATLIGAEESLVLHGGGNTSVKTSVSNILGNEVPVLYVKASGQNMAEITPEGYTGLDLEYLKRLRSLTDLSDEKMLNEFATHMIDARAAAPSIETLVHAFIPKKYIDHTHADVILALTNQTDGDKLVKEVLGSSVLILDYISPGFKLAKAAAAAFESDPNSRAMVLMRHGLLTWGDTARESYNTMIELVTEVEDFLARKSHRPLKVRVSTPTAAAEERYVRVAPIARGLLALPTGDPDQPHARATVVPLLTRQLLDFVDSDRGRELALSPPLTGDHLIRTKALPLWIDEPDYSDHEKIRAQLVKGIEDYSAAYDAYFEKYKARMPKGVKRFDSLPRVILMPGLGALCSGENAAAANIVRDITSHTLAVKAQVAAMGTYHGVAEKDLFDMEYRSLQHAKLRCEKELHLSRHVALITGAAGAIGSGIAQELLEQGCHVAVTDLPGEHLSKLLNELEADYPSRVIGVDLDVTDNTSVARGFETVIRAWGGVDLVVVNAGAAMVSSLEQMDLESFRRLERINVEGTLLVLSESARLFRIQGTGGDIVVVSTKNVFAPGAKFGAYSATKTASHQLARIASLEFGEIGVRVNMVSPDAVFSHGSRPSGLWAEVGPDRMAARGLDPKGLEEYYRSRNILKARITAKHVAKAVLFFATRQTPTTGVTLPVDGGLPDATPR
jgi:rhamnose utilization protein RhaD (predicted bifunctional aldolase and dehydrogenase)/NAD(P)-dependent dehydrogenase (short-subunit alcohol dehydrogenase family)